MAATIKETRRARLSALVQQWIAEDKGNKRMFAVGCDINPSHLSQMLGGTRDVGDQVARRIEKSMLLNTGYLDSPMDADNNSDPSVEEGVALLSQLDDTRLDSAKQYLRNLLRNQALEKEIGL